MLGGVGMRSNKRRTYIFAVLIIFSITITAIPAQASLLYANQEKLPINQEGLDDDFIRLHDYGGQVGKQYNPLFIANDALVYYAAYHDVPKGTVPHPEFREAFFNVVDWLKQHGIHNENGFLIPYLYDVHEYKAPWFSGITQARVAMVFIQAYMWSDDQTYKILAKETLKPIGLSLDEAGFSYIENNLVFLEEYPIRNREIQPNHVLNAHMSILLDMIYINKVLQDRQISELIDSGIYTLKQVLPLYEVPAEMGYAGDLIPGSNIIDGEVNGINGYLSYDLIHMKYLSELYQETKEQIFNEYFFRYYATVYLRKFFEDGNNIVSPVYGTFLESSTGFFEKKPNRLVDAFRNYYVNPDIYAASTKTGENYFVINLNRPVRFKSLNMKFHWDNYPTYFTLEGYTQGRWMILLEETSNGNRIYNCSLNPEVKVSKIRFTAFRYKGQQRLLIDKFFIEPELDQDKIINLWGMYAYSPKLEFLNIPEKMEKWSGAEDITIDQANNDLITEFSKAYLKKYESVEFWKSLWDRNKVEGRFYLIDLEGNGFSFDDLDPVIETVDE